MAEVSAIAAEVSAISTGVFAIANGKVFVTSRWRRKIILCNRLTWTLNFIL